MKVLDVSSFDLLYLGEYGCVCWWVLPILSANVVRIVSELIHVSSPRLATMYRPDTYRQGYIQTGVGGDSDQIIIMWA